MPRPIRIQRFHREELLNSGTRRFPDKKDSNSPLRRTTISAAALQDHFASKFQLNRIVLPIVKKVNVVQTQKNATLESDQRRNGEESNESSWNVRQWTCETCTALNPDTHQVCTACIARKPSRRQRHILGSRNNQSLAQRMGLVAGRKRNLTNDEWEDVKSKSEHRRDSFYPCPICQQDFGFKEQLITSCSHVFHKNCLLSFERFARSSDRQCPVCRSEDYQKHPCALGSVAARSQMATKLSTWWRTCCARVQYAAALSQYYANGGGTSPQRRRYYAAKLDSASTKLFGFMSHQHDVIDALFAECDRNLQASRQVLGGAAVADEGSNKLPSRKWASLKESALQRGLEDCPICVNHMTECESKQLPLVLLSCSHVFHRDCIVSFEQFNKFNGIMTCPLCRDSYERIDFHKV